MPNVLLEAQSYGCPVVATRAGGAPDCLIPGVTGFLLARDDSVGMGFGLRVGFRRSAAVFVASVRLLCRYFRSDVSFVDLCCCTYRRIPKTL